MSEKAVKTAILCRPIVLEDQLAFGLNSLPLLKVSKSSDQDANHIHIGDNTFTPDSFYGYEELGISPADHLPANEIEPLLTSLFNGESAAIIAYGATGSGKSYFIGTESTLKESSNNNPHSALSYIADRLWLLAHQRGLGIDQSILKVDVSMVEIYREGNQREQVFNLLGFREKITRPSSSSSSSIAIWKPVSNEAELLGTLAEGAAIRSTDCNGINLRSSRSHAVITIRIGYTFKGKTVSAKLMLVDLAGSERASGVATAAATAAIATPHKTPIAFAGIHPAPSQQMSATNTPVSNLFPASSSTDVSPTPSFATPMSRLATSNCNTPLTTPYTNTTSRVPRTPASAFLSPSPAITSAAAPHHHTVTLQKQGAGINLGLFHLGRLVESLAQGASSQQQAGMYRNSELTRLLQPALGGGGGIGKEGDVGGCNTLMVGCISPLVYHEERTKNTLEFITKAGTVKNRVRANVVHSEEREMVELKRKVKELEAVNQALVAELATVSSNNSSRPESNVSTTITLDSNDAVTGDDDSSNEKMVHISEEEYMDLLQLGRRERDRADGMAALLRHSQHRAEKLEMQVESLQHKLVKEEEEEEWEERSQCTPSPNQILLSTNATAVVGNGSIAAASKQRRRESELGLSAILSLAVTPVLDAADTLRSMNHHQQSDACDLVGKEEEEEQYDDGDGEKISTDSAKNVVRKRRAFTADELCMTEFSHLREDILAVLKSQIERDFLSHATTTTTMAAGQETSEPSNLTHTQCLSQEDNEIAALRLIVATYNEYLGTVQANLAEASDEVIALQSTQQRDVLQTQDAVRQKIAYAQRCAAAEAELEETKDELVVVKKLLAERQWEEDVAAAAASPLSLSSSGLLSSMVASSPMATGLVSLKKKLSNAVSIGGGSGKSSLAKSLLKKSVSKISLGSGSVGDNSSGSGGGSAVSRLMYAAVSPSMSSAGGREKRPASSSSSLSPAGYSYSPLGGLTIEHTTTTTTATTATAAYSPIESIAEESIVVDDKENVVVIDLTSPTDAAITAITSSSSSSNSEMHHQAPPSDMIQVIYPPKGKKGLFDPENQTVLWRDHTYPASEWAGSSSNNNTIDDDDAWKDDIKLVHPVTKKKSEISLRQWLERKGNSSSINNNNVEESCINNNRRSQTLCCRFCTKNPAKSSAVHPEGFRDIKLCDECYEGLDVGNWKRKDIWWGVLNDNEDVDDDENGTGSVDEGWKYCFMCAGTAPGCTDTLVYCDEPGCDRGFCTGCLWRFTDDDLVAITAEGYTWQCLKCRHSSASLADGDCDAITVAPNKLQASTNKAGAIGTNQGGSGTFNDANIENVPPPHHQQQQQGKGGMVMMGGVAAGGDGKRRRRLIVNRVIPASPSEKDSAMQQLFSRMEARRGGGVGIGNGGVSAEYAARHPHWKTASQLQQQPRF